MISLKAYSSHIYRLSSILWVVLFSFLLHIQTSEAQDLPQFISIVQELEFNKTRLPHPAGLTFSSLGNEFYVVEAQRTGEALPAGTDIRHLSVLGQGAGSTNIAFAIDNPTNMTFDNKTGRLLIYQAAARQLIEISTDAEGSLAAHTPTAYDAGALGLQDPQGMTFDPIHDSLIFLDAVGPRLVLHKLRADGGFSGAEIMRVNLHLPGDPDLRGIAFDPASGNLHLLSPGGKMLYELTLAGELVARRDLSVFQLDNPQAIVFAPSGDQTDDPAELSLYLADSGMPPVASGANLPGGDLVNASNQGKIVEFSLRQALPQVSTSVEAIFISALVRTTDMAAFSPPSPDPSGLAYLGAANTLLVSDCEVEETAGGITNFQGANLWAMSLDGNMLGAANISSVPPTVVPMSDEPAGAAWNPGNGHYYFSDDDALQIFDLNPGLDGLVGTADDTWTSFSTVPTGNGDPEGIAYDSWHERLFVIDGTNREVYQYTLSGDLVEQFDVNQYGAMDPEGIEFNPLEGTLFVLSNRANRVILEMTTSGSLLQTINFSASSAVAPAGLAYAPASDDSGARHFYIVDRGIDNNTDPNIIDGKMYEMTAPATFSKTDPLNGADDQSLSLTLAWTPSPGASEYQYCLDTTGDNACSDWVSTGTATSAAISGLSIDTTYYWHVRAVDDFGTTYANGADTTYWAFTTGGPPGDFTKVAPTNGATDQPLNLTLSWEAASQATGYEYCYDTSDDAACSAWVDAGTATSAAISDLAVDTTYYWQVRAVNEFGTTYANGADTAYWTFTTGGPPGDFNKVAPPNSATDQPLNLTLSWEAASQATGYEYCYDTSNDDACSGWVNTGTATSVEISDLSAGTTYYWHVRALDAFGTTYSEGSNTAYWSFTTGSLPGDFNKISPTNGATDQPLNLTLSWGTSSEAASYEYCYDTTSADACSAWVDAGTATSAAISGLALNTTIYWHVRAINSYGITYSDSAITAFAWFSTTSGAVVYLPYVIR
jgi:uncharacterized protein YjiK